MGVEWKGQRLATPAEIDNAVTGHPLDVVEVARAHLKVQLKRARSDAFVKRKEREKALAFKRMENAENGQSRAHRPPGSPDAANLGILRDGNDWCATVFVDPVISLFSCGDSPRAAHDRWLDRAMKDLGWPTHSRVRGIQDREITCPKFPTNMSGAAVSRHLKIVEANGL